MLVCLLGWGGVCEYGGDWWGCVCGGRKKCRHGIFHVVCVCLLPLTPISPPPPLSPAPQTPSKHVRVCVCVYFITYIYIVVIQQTCVRASLFYHIYICMYHLYYIYYYCGASHLVVVERGGDEATVSQAHGVGDGRVPQRHHLFLTLTDDVRVRSDY
jgi:hypothetical protein